MDITDDIRRRFRAIQQSKDKAALIKYLEELLLKDENSDMLTGFCLWNISYQYAMLRMPKEQYDCHRRFSAFVNKLPAKYKAWCVCDTTQRFTLESGGYGDFWWELYFSAAAEPDISSIEGAIFEMHRAALSVNPEIKTPHERTAAAAENMRSFLDRSKDSEHIDFYRLVYAALCLRAGIDSGINMADICEKFLPLLSCPDSEQKYVTGEWQQINRCRSDKNKAQVGLNSAINALISIGYDRDAAELYRCALSFGMPKNAYIESRSKITFS